MVELKAVLKKNKKTFLNFSYCLCLFTVISRSARILWGNDDGGCRCLKAEWIKLRFNKSPI